MNVQFIWCLQVIGCDDISLSGFDNEPALMYPLLFFQLDEQSAPIGEEVNFIFIRLNVLREVHMQLFICCEHTL